MFVLGLFDIAVTLVDGPGIAHLDLVAVDVVAVPLLVVLSYEWFAERPPLRLTARGIAVVVFAGFVAWTVLAAVLAAVRRGWPRGCTRSNSSGISWCSLWPRSWCAGVTRGVRSTRS